MTSWTAEWDEYGGYDCMTAGWKIKDGDELVAEIDCGAEDHKDNPTAAANARLIAAAPDMFRILKELLMPCPPEYAEATEQRIKALIEKVKS